MALARNILAVAGGAAFSISAASPGVAGEPDRSPLTFSFGEMASVTLYGYVKLDLIWDDKFDMGRNSVGITAIGLPNGPQAGPSDRQQFSESRAGLEFRFGKDVLARLEGDLYGPDDTVRLRHAYVEWRGIMVGQNWTNFMSVETLADTVDGFLSAAAPFARLPQVRYTYDGFPNWILSTSIEQDVGNSSDFGVTAAARFGFDGGMVRASALWRDTVLSGTQVDGWAVNLSGLVTPWPNGTIKATVTTGSGLVDILEANLSGTAVSLNGNPVGFNAATITLSHQVTEKLNLAATGSWINLDQAIDADTSKVETLHLSAFYDVRKNTTLMAEFFTGTRTQGDWAQFGNNRYQLAIRFAF